MDGIDWLCFVSICSEMVKYDKFIFLSCFSTKLQISQAFFETWSLRPGPFAKLVTRRLLFSRHEIRNKRRGMAGGWCRRKKEKRKIKEEADTVCVQEREDWERERRKWEGRPGFRPAGMRLHQPGKWRDRSGLSLWALPSFCHFFLLAFPSSFLIASASSSFFEAHLRPSLRQWPHSRVLRVFKMLNEYDFFCSPETSGFARLRSLFNEFFFRNCLKGLIKAAKFF